MIQASVNSVFSVAVCANKLSGKMNSKIVTIMIRYLLDGRFRHRNHIEQELIKI